MKLLPIQIPTRPKGLRVDAFAVAEPRFAADAGSGLIEIFDSIGDGGTTPARVSAALRSIGSKPVTVAINSPGGDAFAGLTIFNSLRGHSAGVTTQVLGLAASAASIIAMAGDRIEVARASELMIHRAQGGGIGDADLMRQVASALDQVDGVMADIYAARTGLPRDQVATMMADETFIVGEEAVRLGFADSLLGQDAVAAPRMAASSAPSSKRELEDSLRSMGLSRSAASRAAGAAWATMHGSAEPESEIDLDAIAQAIADGVTAATPPSRFR